jgi:hypothetical protein
MTGTTDRTSGYAENTRGSADSVADAAIFGLALTISTSIGTDFANTAVTTLRNQKKKKRTSGVNAITTRWTMTDVRDTEAWQQGDKIKCRCGCVMRYSNGGWANLPGEECCGKDCEQENLAAIKVAAKEFWKERDPAKKAAKKKELEALYWSRFNKVVAP